MDSAIIEVEEGKLRGRILTDSKGGKFYSFEGIPYAEAPIGKLRFQPPQPAKTWEGTKDAFQQEAPNYGLRVDFTKIKEVVKLLETTDISQIQPNVGGSEDCLFLNVYTPEITKNSNKAVMFFVHGGAFVMGDTEIYGPEFLVSDDVVLVTVHYRLGALGFLVLDDLVPGNNGLKDLVLALKWVQKNITNFGGNPSNVTIFGESAGGAIVYYLVLSPLSKGLFHKAIVQSGSATSTWARGSYDNGINLAKTLSCNDTNANAVLEFLRELPVEHLFLAQLQMGDDFVVSKTRPFGPVIEKENSNAFITDEPASMICSGSFNHVPLMAGCTSLEGIVFCLMPFIGQCKINIIEDTSLVPWTLNINENLEKYAKSVEMIKRFYFGNETPKLKSQGACKLASDNIFNIELTTALKQHAKKSTESVYIYRFSALTKLGLMPTLYGGVCHGDELQYLFKTKVTPNIEDGSPEDITQRRMVRLWTNFAKYGNPNGTNKDDLIGVDWNPLNPDKMNYLDINLELVEKENLDEKSLEFWKKIYQNTIWEKLFV